MQSWYTGGHLSDALLVRQGAQGNFRPLVEYTEITRGSEESKICNTWYYLTDDGPQGPFTHAQMAVWLQHGYLVDELPVSRGNGEEYAPLSTYKATMFAR